MSKINPFLEKKLKEGIHGSPLVYVVEVEPGTREEVRAQLQTIPNIEIKTQPADRFIVVSAPPEVLDKMEAVPGVVKISAETAVWIKKPILGIPTPLEVFQVPSFLDTYIGRVKLSPIEVPVSPASALTKGLSRAMSIDDTTIVYTTDQQRQWMGIPEENKCPSIICAVADTGLTHPLPSMLIHPTASVQILSKVPGEFGLDLQGHGSWCATCAYGGSATHRKWGLCRGIANSDSIISIQCLSSLGFGMTSWILDAIGEARKRGARVLSMSLGGPLQGSAIDDDPICRLITSLKDRILVVVAAGNEGPAEWTIGSPAACPDALTVGAWSMTDNGVSYFSSRGPSGEFYRDNVEAWDKDMAERGDDMIKPDVCAPGGGRISSADKDEQILSGCSGWMDIYADILPGWGIMKGTCLSGDTRILLNNGQVKLLENMQVGDKLRVPRGEDEVLAFTPQGKAKVFLLEMEDGTIIKATAEHKFLRKNRNGLPFEWVDLDALAAGDKLAVHHYGVEASLRNTKGFKKGQSPWNKGLVGDRRVLKGIALRELNRSPEWVAKAAVKVRSPEIRERISANRRGKCVGQPHPHTENQNEKISLAIQRKYRDKDYIERRLGCWLEAFRKSRAKPNYQESKLGSIIDEVCPSEYRYNDGWFSIDGLLPDFVSINGIRKVIDLFGEAFHDKEEAIMRPERLNQHGYDCLVIWSKELARPDMVKEKIRGFHNA